MCVYVMNAVSQEVAASARRKVAEAVELLAAVTAEIEGSTATTAGSLGVEG